MISIETIAAEELARIKPEMTAHEWFTLQQVILSALRRAALRGRHEEE
jgi:hypothetical protein